MRAVVMQDGKLRVDEVPEPIPGPGEVLVDVLASGICGTDLHCAAHGPAFNAASKGAVGAEPCIRSSVRTFQTGSSRTT